MIVRLDSIHNGLKGLIANNVPNGETNVLLLAELFYCEGTFKSSFMLNQDTDKGGRKIGNEIGSPALKMK